MAEYIQDMADNCQYCPTRYRGGRKNPDNVYYSRKWGYTVYRTYYNKESDEAWEMLLYSLEHQTKLALGGFGEEGVDEDDVHVDPDNIQRLKNFLTIEGREDPSQFEGLDAQGIRDFWNAEELKLEQNVVQIPGQRHRLTSRPDEILAMADWVHRFVLLADEATLKDIANGEFIVKAVSLQLPAGNSWPGAWMRIPTGYLLDLWFVLCDWSSSTEKALRFRGSEEELHSWIWPGDDNRSGTGEYSEIRGFPHYNNQTYLEKTWRRRRGAPPHPLDQEGSGQEGSFRRMKLRRSPDSSPLAHASSDEDRPLRRELLFEARRRKEHASKDVEAAE
ncbi:hypothetical protein RAB80_007424 [Fusarium oxysporum f. sp. vasinfectum]|uniref:Uncharacterized protein n=1 Tax=Fusarium oxysporum f. sp. cubense TaxID=61366 RepID=A0A559KVV9_FUSOC|nr:hypothetical protein RAB80_007424 [Fusarium oxysporum f. sp. vasinfectum]KAK2923526.1 hypothetical protein FoTM2_015683 [Fusarium oxysporum f. sp. vasinfectum]KAK2938796.1 hypothetical protein FoTM2_002014 [Fusarium oxysporum f. sp. vasinfectum]TVY64129.1 hypothetical protein Focb16_v014225 [Fusarium oxysporum f. sp. cubense]